MLQMRKESLTPTKDYMKQKYARAYRPKGQLFGTELPIQKPFSNII